MVGKRFASPKAWRRLRVNTTIQERELIARDIDAIIQEFGVREVQDPQMVHAISTALSGVVWEQREQADRI